MLSADDIRACLIEEGFAETGRTTKTVKYQKADETVFLKAGTNRNPLVVHPDNQARYGMFASMRGVIAPLPLKFYHNSTMRAFPERWNRGKTVTKFGLALGFQSSHGLRVFLAELCHLAPPSLTDDLAEIEKQAIEETEKQELRKARVGQGKFRDGLMRVFSGVCPLTGISQPDLLRASHIKPWRLSNPIERLDPNNGLLLAANADALFDKGYITFGESGELLLSKTLGRNGLSSFGLSTEMNIDLRSKWRSSFMRFHLENIYLA